MKKLSTFSIICFLMITSLTPAYSETTELDLIFGNYTQNSNGFTFQIMNFPFENNDYENWTFRAFGVECDSKCGYVVVNRYVGSTNKNQISVSFLDPGQTLKIWISAQRTNGRANISYFTGSALPNQSATPTPTPTDSKSTDINWMSDCQYLNSSYKSKLTNPQFNLRNEIYRIRGIQDGLTKSEAKIYQDAVKLEQKVRSLVPFEFDCRKLNENTWNQIKRERLSELQLADYQIQQNLAKLKSIVILEINCYKKGVVKTVIGKKPKCPTGYSKVS